MKSQHPVGKLIENIKKLFSRINEPAQLQFILVTEKFDVVRKSSYREWVLRPDGE